MGIKRASITRRPAHPVGPVEQAARKHKEPSRNPGPGQRAGSRPSPRSVKLPQSSVKTTG